MLLVLIDQERTKQDPITMCTWKSATQTCKSTHTSRLYFCFLSPNSLLPSVLLHFCVLSHLIFFPCQMLYQLFLHHPVFKYWTSQLCSIFPIPAACISCNIYPDYSLSLSFLHIFPWSPSDVLPCLFPVLITYLPIFSIPPLPSTWLQNQARNSQFLFCRIKVWLKM